MLETMERDALKRVADVFLMPFFAVDVGEDGRHQYACLNHAYAQLSGLAHEDVVGRHPSEVFSEADSAALLGHFETCLASRETIHYSDVLDMPVGRVSWVTTLSPVSDADGRIVRLFGNSFRVDLPDERCAPIARMARANCSEALYYSAMARIPLGKLRDLVGRAQDPETAVQFERADLLDVLSRLAEAAHSAVLSQAELIQRQEQDLEDRYGALLRNGPPVIASPATPGALTFPRDTDRNGGEEA